MFEIKSKENLAIQIQTKKTKKGYRRAGLLAIEKLKELAVDLTAKNPDEKREMFIKCAETTLNSKLVADYKVFFAKMIVDACSMLDEHLPLNMIGFKQIPGGRFFFNINITTIFHSTIWNRNNIIPSTEF